MDIRMESMPFELDGKTYQLRCNMNVLADVQEMYKGDFGQALNASHSMRSVLNFMAAMLNDYADEQGWPERFTSRKLGRLLQRYEIPDEKIMALVVRSVTPPETPDESPEAEADRGN